MKDYIVSFYYDGTSAPCLENGQKTYDEFFTARNREAAIKKAKKILGWNAVILEINEYAE